jgi:hypothetical protein
VASVKETAALRMALVHQAGPKELHANVSDAPCMAMALQRVLAAAQKQPASFKIAGVNRVNESLLSRTQTMVAVGGQACKPTELCVALQQDPMTHGHMHATT